MQRIRGLVNATKQFCPICSEEVMHIQRYPNYICDACASEMVDENGRAVMFANSDIGGGLIGYRQDKTTRNNWIEDMKLSEDPYFYIREIRCYAAEAHFGGVVSRPVQ
jgi:hypothetical protein